MTASQYLINAHECRYPAMLQQPYREFVDVTPVWGYRVLRGRLCCCVYFLVHTAPQAGDFTVLQIVQQMAELLWSGAYGEPVLEGFIASAGGLDGRLRRFVSSAIAEHLAGLRLRCVLESAARRLVSHSGMFHSSSMRQPCTGKVVDVDCSKPRQEMQNLGYQGSTLWCLNENLAVADKLPSKKIWTHEHVWCHDSRVASGRRAARRASIVLCRSLEQARKLSQAGTALDKICQPFV